MSFKTVWDPKHPALRRIIALILPAIMGFAVTQVSVLIDMCLAFFLGDGANASLWYGNRLMQFPLGLFGIAMGTALLPEFSGQAADKATGRLMQTMSFSVRATFFIVIPASAGLIFLKDPIVRVLFERGSFDAVSTMRTANTVMFYSLGLFAYSGQKMVTSAFYALQDSKTPFVVSSISLVLDTVLNLILMVPLKEGGLALGTAIGGIANFVIQLMILQKKTGVNIFGEVMGSFARISAASIAMGITAMLAHHYVPISTSSELATGILRLAAGIGAGLAVYPVMSLLFRVEEMASLAKLVRTR